MLVESPAVELHAEWSPKGLVFVRPDVFFTFSDVRW